jgi:hypothetical protein
MFYTFRQNNSGGYDIGPKVVIIEADNCTEANSIACDKADVYFDGCDTGRDCNCCGDRWYPVGENDSSESPEYYGVPIDEKQSKKDFIESYPKEVDDMIWGDHMLLKVLYKDGHVFVLELTRKDKEEAKAFDRKTTPFIYGFRYFSTWSAPSDVRKCWQSDYNECEYFDKTGNFSITVSKKKNQNYNNSDYDGICVYGKDKANVDRLRALFADMLSKANRAAYAILAESLENQPDLAMLSKSALEHFKD